MVADDLKLFEFQQSIRKKLNLNSTEGLFFFIADKKLENLSKKTYSHLIKPFFFILGSPLKNVYEKSQDEDGYLYITYSNIEKFGH